LDGLLIQAHFLYNTLDDVFEMEFHMICSTIVKEATWPSTAVPTIRKERSSSHVVQSRDEDLENELKDES